MFHQKSLLQVAGPLWVENILRTTLTTVDVFMLSFYDQDAVAAMGLVNQFVFFLQLMYLMVASGTSILLAQYLGAGKFEDVHKSALASFVLGIIFAIILSIGLSLLTPSLINLYGLEPKVSRYATQFFVIYASGSVFVVFSMLQSTLLRVHGETKAPMYVNIAANILNIIGNSFFLFGLFGAPILGVEGVAISTVFSQAVVCLVLYFVIKKKKQIKLQFSKIREVKAPIYRQILKVGLPSAGENISYNLAQIVNVGFISSFGTVAMTVYTIVGTFLRYVFITSITIGNATQIKIGWWVGQKNEDLAAKKAIHYWLLGIAISAFAVILLNLFQGPIFQLISKSPEVLGLISLLLLVSIPLEIGRNFNVILIPALKGSGDYRFPVVIGIIFMWGIGVFGGWLLGVHLGMGLVGVYWALALDEWVRGVIMFFRWRSGKWRGRSFVSSNKVPAE